MRSDRHEVICAMKAKVGRLMLLPETCNIVASSDPENPPTRSVELGALCPKREQLNFYLVQPSMSSDEGKSKGGFSCPFWSSMI